MRGLRVFSALVRKDLYASVHSKRLAIGLLGFALLLVVVASFAFSSLSMQADEKLQVSSGIIWLIFVFVSTTFLNQSFLLEYENKAYRASVLSPVAFWLLYASKYVSCTVSIFTLQLLVIFFQSIFFNVPLLDFFFELSILTLLSSGAIASLGTLLASITMGLRKRELLLPIMLFPFLLPMLAGSVELTNEIVSGGGIEASNFWLWFLVCANTIPFALSILVFESVMRD